MKHKSDCNWERSNCEYKKTHEYCWHPEHACSCIFETKPIYVVCPFCKEKDFDLIGLKYHLTNYCKVYAETEN